MIIPLKTIYSAAPNRAAGYVDEVKKRGKIEGDSVDLSKEDFEYIAKHYKLGVKVEVKNETASVKQAAPVANLLQLAPSKIQSATSGSLISPQRYHLEDK